MVQIKIIQNIEEYTKYLDSVWAERNEVENHLALKHKGVEFDIVGYCLVCAKSSDFKITWSHSCGTIPNYREHLLCQHCYLRNRQRFLIHYTDRLLTDTSKIYLYEETTQFYKEFIKRNSGITVIGSEYLGEGIKSGTLINNIRHEDALKTSFQNDSFDLIISNDVFEHVADIENVIIEAYRILKLNGRVLFSIPFHVSEYETCQRARIENNEIIHLKPPQYHVNPVDEKGSLVFYDFGWDLLDLFRENGFRSVVMLNYYSMFYGHIGDANQYIFEARK